LLATAGRSDARLGNLNHPTVWSRDTTMLAFFGFNGGELIRKGIGQLL
jgi:hypothetical protein